MYETLKEKELCRILDTDSRKGLTQEEAERRLKSPVFRRSTRKFPAFLFFSFFVSSSVPRFFLYLQQIFNALSGLFLLEKFF